MGKVSETVGSLLGALVWSNWGYWGGIERIEEDDTWGQETQEEELEVSGAILFFCFFVFLFFFIQILKYNLQFSNSLQDKRLNSESLQAEPSLSNGDSLVSEEPSQRSFFFIFSFSTSV